MFFVYNEKNEPPDKQETTVTVLAGNPLHEDLKIEPEVEHNLDKHVTKNNVTETVVLEYIKYQPKKLY